MVDLTIVQKLLVLVVALEVNF